MSSSSIYKPKFLAIPNDGVRHEIYQGLRVTTLASCRMGMDSKFSQKERLEEMPVQIPGLWPSVPPCTSTFKSPILRFDWPQQLDPELSQGDTYEFKQFVAREAVLDEEFWKAAWLRAESHWEGQASDRYVDNHKKKFAEQEFHALKRRCKVQYGHRCMCIVTVRKQQNKVKQTVLSSVVGTLDLSTRFLLQGELFPGERMRPPLFRHVNGIGQRSYGYITNLCVAKSDRRQGIATNMMLLALESAKAPGIRQVYAHVHRQNRQAQELYFKLGFEVIEEATAQLAEEQQYLLCLDI